MLQQIRTTLRRFRTAVISVTASAWLMFGVAPCLMAAPETGHDSHHDDCPHCETDVATVAPACDVPADAVPAPDTSPDAQPALPANHAAAITRVSRAEPPPPLPAAPHERPARHRYCRLLE